MSSLTDLGSKGTGSGILLVASFYIQPGREAEFREFETKAKAARIMRDYGGRIERVIRPAVSFSGEPLPHEVHLVSFPNMERFTSYRSDPVLAKFAALRELAIARTTIMMGHEIEPYL